MKKTHKMVALELNGRMLSDLCAYGNLINFLAVVQIFNSFKNVNLKSDFVVIYVTL